jgi:hypothetical protein
MTVSEELFKFEYTADILGLARGSMEKDDDRISKLEGSTFGDILSWSGEPLSDEKFGDGSANAGVMLGVSPSLPNPEPKRGVYPASRSREFLRALDSAMTKST